MFRRGVSPLIGVGVRTIRFNAISDLKGSRRRRWGSLFDQHSHALIANTLLATYLDEVLAAKFQALKKLNAWLQQQMDELRERTVAATAAVEQFKSQTELTDSDRGALENIAKLRDLESVAQGYRAIYDNFVHRYAETMQTSSPTVEARVITPAIPPGLKSWPKPAVILPATAFLGAAFGIPHRWLDYF